MSYKADKALEKMRGKPVTIYLANGLPKFCILVDWDHTFVVARERAEVQNKEKANQDGFSEVDVVFRWAEVTSIMHPQTARRSGEAQVIGNNRNTWRNR